METFPFSVSGNYTIIVGGPRTMVSECVVQGVGSKRRKKKIGKNRTVLYTECSQGSTVDVVVVKAFFLHINSTHVGADTLCTVARAQPTFTQTHQPNVHQLALHTLLLSPGP